MDRVSCLGTPPDAGISQISGVRFDVVSIYAIVRPSGEYFGVVLTPRPLVSIRGSPEPSDGATATCLLIPNPSLTRKVSIRPSGDQLGLVCSRGAFVIGVTSPVRTSTTPICVNPEPLDVTATRVPSGDHAGEPTFPNLESTRRRASPPSALMM